MAKLGESTNLDSSLRENRVFAPPAEFAAKAHVKSLGQYEEMYRRSVERPDEFWAEAAGELLEEDLTLVALGTGEAPASIA